MSDERLRKAYKYKLKPTAEQEREPETQELLKVFRSWKAERDAL